MMITSKKWNQIIISFLVSISLICVLSSCKKEKEHDSAGDSKEITQQTDEIKDTFLVTFQDFDGTVLKQEKVLKGENAVAPNNPTREGYLFLKWDKSFECISSDLTIVAEYEKIEMPKIVVENAYCHAGETAEVGINFTNNPGIAVVVLSVSYNYTLLRPVNVIYGDDYSEGGEEAYLERNPINLVWVDLAESTVDGLFAKLQFEVSTKVKSGDEIQIQVSYSDGDILNIAEEKVAFQIVQGKIIIE